MNYLLFFFVPRVDVLQSQNAGRDWWNEAAGNASHRKRGQILILFIGKAWG
jgi:hypothetical protein